MKFSKKRNMESASGATLGMFVKVTITIQYADNHMNEWSMGREWTQPKIKFYWKEKTYYAVKWASHVEAPSFNTKGL